MSENCICNEDEAKAFGTKMRSTNNNKDNTQKTKLQKQKKHCISAVTTGSRDWSKEREKCVQKN